MNRRSKIARTLAVLGSVVLYLSACLHCLAYTSVSPGLSASSLAAPLQSVARVAFLAMAWDWVVLGTIVLVAVFAETRRRKAFVLICAIAVLAETALTLHFVGLFIGNELIGAAGLLILGGGLLLQRSDA